MQLVTEDNPLSRQADMVDASIAELVVLVIGVGGIGSNAISRSSFDGCAGVQSN
jgi:cell division GTPase FtsZ